VSNHQSIGDPYLFSQLPNDCVFISNQWPFEIPILGFFAKMAGYLNAQVLSPETLYEQAKVMLAEGSTLVCFAEGTRTRTGELGAFHTTGFRLALQAGAAIVPLCIKGSYWIIPPGQMLLRPGIINIRALPALHSCDYSGLNPYQLKEKVRSLIASELAVMEGGAA